MTSHYIRVVFESLSNNHDEASAMCINSFLLVSAWLPDFFIYPLLSFQFMIWTVSRLQHIDSLLLYAVLNQLLSFVTSSLEVAEHYLKQSKFNFIKIYKEKKSVFIKTSEYSTDKNNKNLL